MSELISGKEALIALANGEEVQYFDENLSEWIYMDMSNHFKRNFRLKPRTITLNGIEVPAPFEPKEGEVYFYLNSYYEKGYDSRIYSGKNGEGFYHKQAWRTEAEIKQVVAALRSVFKGGEK